MKKIILLFAVVALCASNKPANNVKIYDLEEAIANKLISYEFRGNNESPHYYQPLVANITNRTSEAINIRIPNGFTFKSNSTDHQDIIITQEELIAIDHHKSLEKPLFGMCIEKYHIAPNASELYTPNGMTNTTLNLLTTEIEKRKAYDYAAQNAIWNLTNDGTLSDIAGYDIAAGAPLRAYIAGLLDLPEDQMPEDVAQSEDQLIKRTAGGNFRYKFSNTSAVTIGMFNDKDIIVKELYHNPETPAGEHRLSYEFDTLQYPDEVYYIRLIINGQIKINFEMKPRGA
jgi:hypothetical protein